MKARLSEAMMLPLGALWITVAQAAPQSNVSPQAPETMEDAGASKPEDLPADIIVVGSIRTSLERAAEIKQNAVQIVDSIVAQDIGKFPDPTTAAALQRVPGVQVQFDRNNELGGVRIRGLPDTLTTVNGREVFTTTGRNFNLQDLPAEALARVDVVKSQTADLIEGGLAGNIDLQLNRPFNFKNPTFILNARGNYGVLVNEINPQFGALLTDRWDTGVGEIGLLVNATWNKTYSYQPETTAADPRIVSPGPLTTSSVSGPVNYLFPSILQNITQSGTIWHSQGNASLQWQIDPALRFYADGFYTATKNTVSYTGGGNLQPFTTNVGIRDIVASPDDCFLTRFNSSGQNARVLTDAQGRRYIEDPRNLTGPGSRFGYRVQEVCKITSATVTNSVINQTSHATNFKTTNKMAAAGLQFDRDRVKWQFDVAYQTSRNIDEQVTADVGQRLPVVQIETDVDGAPLLTIPGDSLMRRDTLFLRNGITQNYIRGRGELFQATFDGQREFDWFIRNVDVGLRYASRQARFDQYNVTTGLPAGFGNLGTGSEATARRVVDLSLPTDFLYFGPPAPGIKEGARFLTPNVGFLRSLRGRDFLRGVFRLPAGQPPYQQSRQFDAAEKVLSSYIQATYAVPLFTGVEIDGVFGVRAIRTERDVQTQQAVGSDFLPRETGKSDVNILPNASARLRFDGGVQLRAIYAKTIRRPDFTALNPSLNLIPSQNPFLVSTGSSGNPDLRPQQSDSIDVSLEYFFRSGYLAVTGYYRDIVDRVITSPSIESFGGIDYVVSRPRNVGEAQLKGIEVSGQYFFDFLPGALAGLGASGAFTLSDTEIRGTDALVGNPLQGVSRYNYTAGVLYDRYGISGRLVYTYRSKAWQGDQTGSFAIRPVDESRVDEAVAPTLFRWLAPNGRLDFSLGYDLNDRIRVDVGGTNILCERNRTYWGIPQQNSQVFQIETTYTVGARIRL